jgi:aldehyde:ferredoxin oxidoreductase
MELLPFKTAAEITKAVTGIPFTENEMFDIGERIVNLERAYIVQEGIRRKDDYLPKRFLTEPLPNGNSKGSIFEIEPMLDEYYNERGWNKNGVPKAQTLKKLNLGNVAKKLSQHITLP